MNRLAKLTIASVIVWILSILVFGLSIALGTDWLQNSVDDTQFGNSTLFVILVLGSMGIGALSFGLAILFGTLRIILKNGWLSYKKSFMGFVLFVLKFLLVLAVLPIFFVWRIASRKYKAKLSTRIIKVCLVLATLFPLWVVGYWSVGAIAAYQLGYVPEDMTIVGTGSMYPTWAKGTKGKDPKELADEVIATAGFLKYPNGVVVFGNRLLGHTIDRGDIVTAENEAIRKSTGEIYGTPSGVLKRVVAIGGDEIELRDGIVYLNDEPVKEPYIAKPRSTFGEAFLTECKKYTVPSDSVFLMGDNRKSSGDSREFGPVKYSEIDFVLPLSEQKGSLDKNWRDTANDFEETLKPTIDRTRFVELLNQKRKENGAGPITYDPDLEKSAGIRGEELLKSDSFDEEATYEVIIEAMRKVGYWNPYVWEYPIQGYYEADELIEDYLERDWTDSKNSWFDSKFDDIGIAEVQGTLNGCPTQTIVIHAAGYIPATYEDNVVQGWREVVININSVVPSWENIKGKGWVDEQDLSHLLALLYREREIATKILGKMESGQWLSEADNISITEYNNLANESNGLASKLNGE